MKKLLISLVLFFSCSTKWATQEEILADATVDVGTFVSSKNHDAHWDGWQETLIITTEANFTILRKRPVITKKCKLFITKSEHLMRPYIAHKILVVKDEHETRFYHIDG